MNSPSESLIGREGEISRLEGALDGLEESTAGCLVIEGDPGIGKTRLLGELRRRAEERGHIVLHSQAAEFEQDLPFGAVAEALDPFVDSKRGSLDGLDALTAELAPVLPSIARDSGAGASTIGDDRYRAHRAVRGLLELLSEEKPIVLALDDLHWGDDASIELIAALLRRPPDAPVLFALAFRPGHASERLSVAVSAPLASRLELAQLSEAEAAELLGGIDEGALSAIYRHGGGNPFYLQQLSRLDEPLRLGGGLAGSFEEVGVPAAVAASLTEEVGVLSPQARQFVEAAAVAGEPFEPDLAAAIAGVPEPDGLDALDDLLARDLVRPTEVPRRFIFRHPLLRRTVYESIPGGSRLAAHGRAADALAERGAPAAERAHHVEQAAGLGDMEAVEVLLEAAAAAAPRAPASAARWLDAALRLMPESEREREVEARKALASALRSTGEFERCRETLLETIEMLPADDADRRIELTTWCAAVEHWLGRHSDAHARLSRAWDELENRESAPGVALAIELAVDGLYTLDFERTLELGELALDGARKLGDEPLIATAAAALALGESTKGVTERAQAHRAEAVELIDRLTDEELAPRVEAFYYLAWGENYLERYDESLAHIDRAIAIARSTGEGRLLIPLMLTKGYPLEMQGRLEEAAEICEAAVEAARLSGNPHYLFWSLFELAWPRYFAGDLDGAIAACEESLKQGGGLTGATMPSSGGGPGWALGTALFAAGEHERGAEAMRALGGDEVEFAVPVERCFDWEMFAQVELAKDDAPAAARHAERAERLAAELGLDLPAGLAKRTRAAVLLHTGEAAAAAELAGESAEDIARAGATLQVAFSLSLQGTALAAAGERKQAIDVLRAAERELDRMGSTRERDLARRELRKLGGRREARGPSGAGESGVAALTKRELEIAGLITDRLTNKQIAAELFLSQKTVESHIRNIFFKLSVDSRVDVARAMERERSEAPS